MGGKKGAVAKRQTLHQDAQARGQPELSRGAMSNRRCRASGMHSNRNPEEGDKNDLTQTKREGKKKPGDMIMVFRNVKGCFEGEGSKCSL